MHKNIVFSQVNPACVSGPFLFYSLIHDKFVWRGPANGFCNLRCARFLEKDKHGSEQSHAVQAANQLARPRQTN
jgi:hypothetical protein